MSRLAIMFGLILFCLMATHGKQLEFDIQTKKKEIQIRRLAKEICRNVTNDEVQAKCIEHRIEWSKPI